MINHQNKRKKRMFEGLGGRDGRENERWVEYGNNRNMK